MSKEPPDAETAKWQEDEFGEACTCHKRDCDKRPCRGECGCGCCASAYGDFLAADR